MASESLLKCNFSQFCYKKSLLKKIALNFSDGFKCGGSLINSRWILTTASCIESLSALNFYSIEIGLYDRRQREEYTQTRKPKKIIVHSSYSNDVRRLNDIALIKLDVSVCLFTHQ
jgi:secreted trypsin-like serine protease